MFVTLKVFKLIGPSNDGRRHGRGTYLLLNEASYKRVGGSFFFAKAWQKLRDDKYKIAALW
jgi:hypothetical protein